MIENGKWNRMSNVCMCFDSTMNQGMVNGKWRNGKEFSNDSSKHWPFIMLLHRNGLLNFRDLCTVQLYQIPTNDSYIRYTVARAQWNVSVTKSWICYCRCWCSFYIFLFRCKPIWENCTIVMHSTLSSFFPILVACSLCMCLNINSIFQWLFSYSCILDYA